ncbi:uncharacterized protein PHACADRAFT_197587 [Phanerochaete carnosa HHB-10118-sp]|uniref:Uncharacterized protein n=1 Tax=Phanerochaete carnosa (strain HHB-10118-sp) TaxID=650164 RepID=K5W212_PHACS|nr:uncharacterized protein PHACADRAFT_197587 [Phanerochaete carnosa HHB-10118-sp]EKM53160.1 hypothetical protein PHACADRAFT_197587 [Phanerochaete carnosa HHB-10118-sp]
MAKCKADDADLSDEDDVAEVSAPEATNKTKDDEQKKAHFEKKYKVSEHTKEEVLDSQHAVWRLKVYKHFHPPTIVVVDSKIKYKFVYQTNQTTKSCSVGQFNK